MSSDQFKAVKAAQHMLRRNIEEIKRLTNVSEEVLARHRKANEPRNAES